MSDTGAGPLSLTRLEHELAASCDGVPLAVGSRPNNEIARMLKPEGSEIYPVGDCGDRG